MISFDKMLTEFRSGRLTLDEVLRFRTLNNLPFRAHPLGFMVCNLISDGPRKLRLHVWPEGPQATDDAACSIHDHLFNFESLVLAGKLVNIEYQRSSNGREFARYNAKYIGDVSVLERTSESMRVLESSRTTIGTGSFYSIEAGVLHETLRVDNSFVATLLVTFDVSNEPPVVLGPMDGADEYRFHRVVLPELQVSLALPKVVTKR